MSRKCLRVIHCATLVAVLLSTGCREQPQPPAKATEKGLEDIFFANKEHVAILSAKYQVPGSAVSELLRAYMRRHDFSFAITMGNTNANAFADGLDFRVVDGNAIPQTLSNLSTKYEVPIDKVAAIIMDFRVWTAADKECN